MRFLLVVLCLMILLLPACKEDPKPIVDEDIYLPEDHDDQADRSRMIWQQPGAVMDAMGDIREKVIADIGAGEGFFAERLAPIADRVIAVEIDEKYISYLDTLRRFGLQKEFRPRLEPRLATADDPHLEDKEVDIILIVNTFMLIENKVDYLKKLYPSLRSDGRIVIVDWKRKDTTLGPPKQERLALGTLQDMLKEAGYHIVSSDDATLAYQYIVVADK
ncbi:MAG: class I SAM-dependent methyltransferase [Bacteroidota bacterium]